MRAVVQHRYGGTEVLGLEEVPAPTRSPGTGEVLVRVGAAAVDRGTVHVMNGLPLMARPAFGLRRPSPRWRTPGRDLAGTVEAVGPGVVGWATGDPVHGTADGSLAELVVTSAGRIAHPPEGLSTVEAAALPISGLTAYQAVRDAGVAPGQRVLVVGSSGGVGHLAVQCAVAAGATVTAVCGPGGADLARSLGAAHVLDRTHDTIDAEGVRYDVVLDIMSNRRRRDLRRVLAERGTLVCIGTQGGRFTDGVHRSAAAALLSPFVRHRLVMHVSKELGTDLAELDTLVAAGAVRPVIDATYPLERAADAIDHVASGRARGKVVVTLDAAA
ncbi:NAD(P)-dependent alcohol dehydrogenase [Oryzobacter telluris]|uniref:NAD(P)-dependent alcohol dehydrogenase n=1 Tax=Oryzobacter telluris TaxID=3149179 RepID=UPI00370D8C58